MIRKSYLKKRHASEKRFKIFGLGAIIVSFLFLLFLLFTIISNGIGGFVQTKIKFEITGSNDANYAQNIRDALNREFPDVSDHDQRSQLYSLVDSDAKFILQDLKIPSGKTEQVWLPAEQKLNVYFKQSGDGWQDKLTALQKKFVQHLKEKRLIREKFNSGFFTNSDSQSPVSAGIAGALVGTLFMMIACMGIALPVGIFTAIYLEEFAPKNRLTTALEVNISNLAAVPSIVFGLLGLAVFLNFFGMPRSAPLVGGMTLSLMVIPIIIITTRASIKAVPPSIRQGAMALGASPLQVVMHHTLPLSLPGIMTGTILGLARALGETAPLIMIGMVAFIASVPRGFLDPATAMPVQIFLWSRNSDAGYVEKTSAAIIVLLLILIALNIVAVLIRKKYERRW